MSDLIPGFIRIADVKEYYRTSRKTVERRRDRAREMGEHQVYRYFRLRTKDGEIFVEPTLGKVHQLTKEGRVPEWYVARAWLVKEFGEREREESTSDNTTGSPADRRQELRAAIDVLKEQYEARIADLKEQLLAAEKREQRAAEAADKDKQRFANATAQLTQVLALPGIAEATKARRESVIPSSASDSPQSSSSSADDPSGGPAASSEALEKGRWRKLFLWPKKRNDQR